MQAAACKLTDLASRLWLVSAARREINHLTLLYQLGSIRLWAKRPRYRCTKSWECADHRFRVDLRPNLSVTGSLATILWLVALRREKIEVGAWPFLKLGLLVTPPALIAALAAAIR